MASPRPSRSARKAVADSGFSTPGLDRALAILSCLGATAQIFEVDAQKKLLRQFTDHRQFTSINHIQVLE